MGTAPRHLSTAGTHRAASRFAAQGHQRNTVDSADRRSLRDLPEEFGKWGTVYDLFTTWREDGTLDEILNRLRAGHVDGEAIDDQLWCVDGTNIRAARCAAGAEKRGH